VVIAGRPLALGPGTQADGLLMAYLPGTEGGSAVADVLFGRVNPSGRLPFSWPSESTQSPPLSQFNPGAPSLPGDQPKFLDMLPGTNFGQGSGYNPLFAFGTGLSYTTFQNSGLSVPGTVSARGTVDLTFTASNTGNRAGTNVIPVYVHQPVSDVVAPDRRLVAFARVSLNAGESRTVRLSFPASRLAVTPADVDGAGTPAVAAGSYQLLVGNLTASFTVRR
jgi:beta-glucosidase